MPARRAVPGSQINGRRRFRFSGLHSPSMSGPAGPSLHLTNLLTERSAGDGGRNFNTSGNAIKIICTGSVTAGPAAACSMILYMRGMEMFLLCRRQNIFRLQSLFICIRPRRRIIHPGRDTLSGLSAPLLLLPRQAGTGQLTGFLLHFSCHNILSSEEVPWRAQLDRQPFCLLLQESA